jgi:hypothetical protein
MSDTMATPCNAALRYSHIWDRHEDDWYVEPEWCSRRLFAEEAFLGEVWDPACGLGRIVRSALDAGYPIRASDVVFRQSNDEAVDELKCQADFFTCDCPSDNVICNPPFAIAPAFAQHALKLAERKAAIIFPVARLNAAHWIKDLPLCRIWLMTPRPSMPPGSVIAAGAKPGGGKMDFCWLVFEQGYSGEAGVRWLKRDVTGGAR